MWKLMFSYIKFTIYWRISKIVFFEFDKKNINNCCFSLFRMKDLDIIDYKIYVEKLSIALSKYNFQLKKCFHVIKRRWLEQFELGCCFYLDISGYFFRFPMISTSSMYRSDSWFNSKDWRHSLKVSDPKQSVL